METKETKETKDLGIKIRELLLDYITESHDGEEYVDRSKLNRAIASLLVNYASLCQFKNGLFNKEKSDEVAYKEAMICLDKAMKGVFLGAKERANNAIKKATESNKNES